MNKNLKDRLYLALTDGLDMEEELARHLTDEEPGELIDAVHKWALKYDISSEDLEKNASYCEALGSRLTWFASFLRYESRHNRCHCLADLDEV